MNTSSSFSQKKTQFIMAPWYYWALIKNSRNKLLHRFKSHVPHVRVCNGENTDNGHDWSSWSIFLYQPFHKANSPSLLSWQYSIYYSTNHEINTDTWCNLKTIKKENNSGGNTLLTMNGLWNISSRLLWKLWIYFMVTQSLFHVTLIVK